MKPIFSVVIPLFNKADTIERAIRSVARQTFANYELIVVNDGSTDDSLEIVNRLSRQIKMRVVDKPNGGVSSARNAGARVATGDYIALLDGDDEWYPKHLGRMAEAVRRYPEIGLFGGGYEWRRDGRIYFTWGRRRHRILDVFDAYRYAQPIHTSSIVVRKDLWMAVGGFDERYSYFEDHEFFFRLGEKTKCCLVPGISERYTTDAFVRATGKTVKQDPRTWPHIMWLNQQILDGRATASMIRYVRTQAKLKASFAYLHQNYASIEFWDENFEGVVETFRLWRMFLNRRKAVGCVLYAHLFLFWYRLHNHMILWVKRDTQALSNETFSQ